LIRKMWLKVFISLNDDSKRLKKCFFCGVIDHIFFVKYLTYAVAGSQWWTTFPKHEPQHYRLLSVSQKVKKSHKTTVPIKTGFTGLSKRREGGKNGKVGNWAGFRVRVRIGDILTLILTLVLTLAITVTLIPALTLLAKRKAGNTKSGQ